MKNALRAALCGALVAAGVVALACQAQPPAVPALRDRPVGPPTFPNDVLSFGCRASRARAHRTQPWVYHSERAQRLLGQGGHLIGCEAYGLDRFRHSDDPILQADQIVREAESAAANQTGMGQGAPEALLSLMRSAYEHAAKAYSAYGAAHRSATHAARAKTLAAKAREQAGRADKAVDLRTPLMAAVLGNDLSAAAKLIVDGADVNATDTDHTSALRLAVVASRTEIVELLLYRGAKADEPDEEGVTALMDACSMGRTDVALLLLENGAVLNARAADGLTPLLNAAGGLALGRHADTRRELIRLLVTRGADVNASDWEGRTPLLAAVREANPETVRLLVSAGADVNAADAKGDTPLMGAVERDSIASVRLLLEHRAATNARNAHGLSALSLAVRKGYREGVEIALLLLNAGADANLADPTSNFTPLMWAEGFNYKRQEPYGESAHAIVAVLLERGADPNAPTTWGLTPLMIAAEKGGPDDVSFVDELVKAGADVHAADKDGKTALMAAAERGHVGKVRVLLAHGARADANDERGRTALQYARPFRDIGDDPPYCYDSQDSDTSERLNDCEGTRQSLRQALDAQSARPRVNDSGRRR